MRRSRGLSIGLALLALTMLTTPADGIVIRHDRRDAVHRTLAEVPQAVELSTTGGAGLGTLISPAWILTAAHVAQHKRPEQRVAVGDSSYSIVEVIEHPAFDLHPIRHDLALVRLDRPVVGIEPARLYEGDDEVGMDVLFVGSGDFGTGLTGPEARDRIRRGATNRVVRADSLWIAFRFDAPDDGGRVWADTTGNPVRAMGAPRGITYYEGISGPGDSGGAAFVETDSTLWVIGVSSWQDTAPTGRVQGLYGVYEHYTRVSTHLPWIRETMGRPWGE
jgi:hypothetical protein